jgi:hypothetical protein
LWPTWNGSWWGLAVAVAFAAALNVAIVTTFVWRELVSSAERSAGWVAIAAVWLVCAGWTFWRVRRADFEQNRPPEDGDLFPRAVNEYLRKNWSQAERILTRLIGRRRADGEAQLLLSAVWRRTGRTDEARQLLVQLAQSDAGERWKWEIEREIALLDGDDRSEEMPETHVEQKTGETQTSVPQGVQKAA